MLKNTKYRIQIDLGLPAHQNHLKLGKVLGQKDMQNIH